jgi:hypothetical protein
MFAVLALSAAFVFDGDSVKAKAADAKSAAAPAPLVVKPIAPVAESDRAGAVARGVDFLLRTQNKTGSWGAPTKTKELNIMADIGSHTAFRVGTTSLVVMALCECEKDRPEVTPAIKKGEEWLVKTLPELRRGTAIELYNVWGHAYAIQALVHLKKRPDATAERKATFDRLIKEQLELLRRYASVDGGWGYYDFRAQAATPTTDSTSFVNAAVLIAMHDAKEAGIEPSKKVIDKAKAATVRQRKPDFTYLYGEYLKTRPMMGINRIGGSLGRSNACNLALKFWGDPKITDDVIKTCLHRLFARHLWLDIGRKRPIPHESWMQVAGYFYYYAMYYAGLCVEALPAADRPLFQDHLARVLLDRQELDGSWFDYVLYDYHMQYGTAYAILALNRCKKQ